MDMLDDLKDFAGSALMVTGTVLCLLGLCMFGAAFWEWLRSGVCPWCSVADSLRHVDVVRSWLPQSGFGRGLYEFLTAIPAFFALICMGGWIQDSGLKLMERAPRHKLPRKAARVRV